MNVLERFESKVFIAPDGCWLWTAGVNKDGYGRFKLNNNSIGAHRISYELFIGEIPSDKQIDHLCRQRSCVNPNHLEAVLPEINTRRGNRTKQLCEHGIGITNCKNGCSQKYKSEYVKRNRIQINERQRIYYAKRKGN